MIEQQYSEDRFNVKFIGGPLDGSSQFIPLAQSTTRIYVPVGMSLAPWDRPAELNDTGFYEVKERTKDGNAFAQWAGKESVTS